MEQVREGYLDLLRIIACIMVVGVHVSALCLGELDVKSINFKIMNGFDCFSILGVPLFVMISGSLFLSSKHKSSIKDLCLNKAARFAILYFFWLFLYNIENFIYSGEAWTLEAVKHEIILESLFGRGIYHLWFLPMISSLYLITPIIKSFANDQQKCLLFLSIFFIVGILIPTMLKFEFPYKAIVSSIYEQFPLEMFAGYTGYYVMGHALSEFLPKLSNKMLIAAALCGIIFFAVEVYVCNLYSERTGELSIILNDPMAVNAFISSSCIFVLCKHIKNINGDIFRKWAGLTFGIYLLHPFVLELLNHVGVDTLFAPAYVTVPLVVVLVTVITAILVFIFQKLPLVRKLF